MGRKMSCLIFSVCLLFGVPKYSVSADEPYDEETNHMSMEETIESEEEQKAEAIEETVSDEVVSAPMSVEPAMLVLTTSMIDFVDKFNNASDQDELLIGDSFISEMLTATNGVVLTVSNGDTRTLIIDGENQVLAGNTALTKSIFNVTHNGSGTIVFKNMTIKNMPSQAIEIKGSGHVSFENVTFESIKASAIKNGITGKLTIEGCNFLEGGTPALSDESTVSHELYVNNSYFYKNDSGSNYGIGGAMVVSSNAIALVENSTFEENILGTGTGAAIATKHDGTNINLTIEKSYFLANQTTNNVGGAVSIYHLRDGNITINESVFEANKSLGNANISDGGAIAIKNNSTAYAGNIKITNSYFTRNVANDNGAAMLIEASNGGTTNSELYNNTFDRNESFNLGNGLKMGVGGAIQTYDSPSAVISHNTFYRNRSANAGSGGALGLSGSNSQYISPVVANNIFVDNNYDKSPALTTRNVAMKTVKANVDNNGNVGYDAGKKFIPDDTERNDLVRLENIFTDFYEDEDTIPDYAAIGEAKPITFGNVGAQGHIQVNSSYVPSPVIDEMLRTNDPRTVTGVLKDVRGYPREKLTPENPYYPNAGAVEIYWTKFDTGTGDWSNLFDVKQEGGIASLTYPGQFYKVSNPPIFNESGEAVYDINKTFTRKTLVGPVNEGFTGWHNDKLTTEIKDVDEEYTCRKQTFVAMWEQDVFHLDFDLVGGSPATGNENDFTTQIINNGENGNLGTKPESTPIKENCIFDGWYESHLYEGEPWNFTRDTITKDVTLFAKWRDLESYTLDFDMQGHGEQISSQTLLETEIPVQPYLPTEDGYIFEGWYTDTTFETVYDFSEALTENTTVYAKWVKDSTPSIEPNKPETKPEIKPEVKPNTSDTTNTGDEVNTTLWIGFMFITMIVLYVGNRKKAVNK